MKKKLLYCLLLVCIGLGANAQQKSLNTVAKEKLSEDLDRLLKDLKYNYIYFEDKGVDLECLRAKYQAKIKAVRWEEDVVLLFEFLLDELYDNHVMLNTNRGSSYRLYAPIHVSYSQGKTTISHVWQSQVEPLPYNIMGAEVVSFNGVKFEQAIDAFPTQCHNKKLSKVRNWLANKVLAGRYHQPRKLKLKLTNGKLVDFDLDQVKIKPTKGLLSTHQVDNMGIIRINNSLGNNSLIGAFDQALAQLKNTKGLIIDLRNTVDGGNSYVARGIMSRLITKDLPYQRHWTSESYSNQAAVVRSWVEYVSPRGAPYTAPVVVLAGKWTGSMGEGLTIGLEGMKRATVVGTAMERLAGAMFFYRFKHLRYGYRLSGEKLFHVNGTPREQYLPKHLVKPTSVSKDEILEEGLKVLRKQIDKR
jgi:carboxyl-terminal processing protease